MKRLTGILAGLLLTTAAPTGAEGLVKVKLLS